MVFLSLVLAFAAGYGFHNWINNKISKVVSAAVANVKVDIARVEALVTEVKSKV